MTFLRTTAIMKTDLSGSTARFRSLGEADLTAVLAEHRSLVTRIAGEHGGRIVKPEGDGFWIAFPSVTAAALAAMAMQEELRAGEATKGDRRLVMRIVLALGDVLHEEGALVGDAVVMAARIEGLTPPGEIYLSAAAWLAVNKAEVRAALVDAFTLKGFDWPVPVYRVEQTFRTRVLEDQYIVVTDLRGFSAMFETTTMVDVEAMLDRLRELVDGACRDFSGVNRMVTGDSYCLTFPDPKLALGAVERLMEQWDGSRCPLSVAVHKGVLYVFRDFLHSPDLNIATAVERVASRAEPSDVIALVTAKVWRELAGSEWAARLRRVDVEPSVPRLAGLEVYRLEKRGSA